MKRLLAFCLLSTLGCYPFPIAPSPPLCGNALVEAGEECDDGNQNSGDGCSAICIEENLALCGNGNIDPGEDCDDGNNNNNDGCAADCTLEAICGNGILEAGEECDDENTIANDGCSQNCQLEANVFVLCEGAPGGDGSLDSPVDTLANAVQIASANDVIMILPQGGICTSGSGSIAKSLTIQGLADPNDPTAPPKPLLNTGTEKTIEINGNNVTVTVKDLFIVADVINSAPISIDSVDIPQLALLRIDVQNINVVGPNSVAVECNANNEGVLLVDQSVIQDTQEGGLRIQGQCSAIISNTLFQNNGDNTSTRGAMGLENISAKALILFSTFVGNNAIAGRGVLTCPDPKLGFIHGSILNDDNGNIQFDADCKISFSDTFGTTPPPGDNIDENPLFVTVNGQDFHLDTQEPSPCIDTAEDPTTAGIDLPFDPIVIFGVDILSHDFNGNPRPLTQFDMGMFEEQ